MFCSRYDHQTEEETTTSALSPAVQETTVVPSHLALLTMRLSLVLLNLAVTGSNQAYRAISTSQLNALLRLHLWPIDVVVFHGPQGDLVLKGASRLDAFSGYPVRT